MIILLRVNLRPYYERISNLLQIAADESNPTNIIIIIIIIIISSSSSSIPSDR